MRILLSGFFALASVATYSTTSATMLPDTPSLSTDAGALLSATVELGLMPADLTACGASSMAAQMLQRLSSADGHCATLASLRASESQLGQELAELGSRARANPSSESIARELAELQEELSLIAERRQIECDAAFDFATALMPDGMRRQLSYCREAPRVGVPSEFKVVQRTPLEWEHLRDALAAEHRAARTNTAIPGDASTLLEAARSHPDVRLAAARLATESLLTDHAFAALESGLLLPE